MLTVILSLFLWQGVRPELGWCNAEIIRMETRAAGTAIAVTYRGTPEALDCIQRRTEELKDAFIGVAWFPLDP
ncbi:MAG TPA: hypothetical protein VN812_10450 [Candidatus Acidoferrales bacterium]|nr:hypothetical protein [Candidatus Acidoferrales bacterium]